MKFKDTWEIAKNFAEIHVGILHHESLIHKEYNPFPNGFLDKKGEYTKEAKEKLNEMIIHFKEVLDESLIEN